MGLRVRPARIVCLTCVIHSAGAVGGGCATRVGLYIHLIWTGASKFVRGSVTAATRQRSFIARSK